MKFHILRNNEKISDILFMYNISLDELKENNKHISKWDNILPGTKLRLPVITKNDDLELMELEPFIEDYYPTLDVETIESFEDKTILDSESTKGIKLEENKEVDEKADDTLRYNYDPRNIYDPSVSYPRIIQYPYGYYYPYPYYR